jgi:hypothetical protein
MLELGERQGDDARPPRRAMPAQPANGQGALGVVDGDLAIRGGQGLAHQAGDLPIRRGHGQRPIDGQRGLQGVADFVEHSPHTRQTGLVGAGVNRQ